MLDCYALRAQLRGLAVTDRVRDCGRRPVGEPAAIVSKASTGDVRAWWEGVLQCGRVHSCPVCAARRAASRADELGRMVEAGGGPSKWRMLTLTLPHVEGQPLKALRAKLMLAWRKTRRTRTVREIFERRVSASARALEVTHGRNGWHPHLHLLLQTADWSESDRDALVYEWCKQSGASRERGVNWAFASGSYLAKMGAEVAGIGKTPKNGNATPWQLAERALRGDETARALWTEYQHAMHGARILELDERAKELAESRERPDDAEWKTERFELTSEEFRAVARLERDDPAVLFGVLEAAAYGGRAHFEAAIGDALDALAHARAGPPALAA